MTPARLRWCLERIGWSRQELARRLTINESTVAHMVQGKRFIPNRLAIWVDTLANLMIALPRPYLWQENSTIGAMRHNPGVGQLETAWGDPRTKATDPDEDEIDPDEQPRGKK
jgi:transcriptional regulator with XRE-family HTH domain